MQSKPHTVKGHVVVFSAIVLTTLNLRAAITSLSDIYAYVEKDVAHFNTAVMGTLSLLCFAVFGLIAPSLGKKIGYEKTLLFSMLLVGVGLGLRCFATDFPFFLACSIAAFAGMALGNVLLPPMFKKYFPNHIGAITSVYSVMIAVSAGVPSVLSADLAPVSGWKVSLGIWALVGFAAAAPWLMQILTAKDTIYAEAGNKNGTSTGHMDVIGWKKGWMMALLFGLGGMLPMYTVINWLPSYLESNGISGKDAGGILFLYNTVGIVHSFLVPLILPKLKKPFLLIILAVIFQVTGYLGFLYNVQNSWIWAIVAAPGLLTIPVTFQLFNMRSRTPAGSAHLSSFVQFVGYLIAAAGPSGFAALMHTSGGYTVPFQALLLVSLTILYFGRESLKPGYIEDRQMENA